MSSCFYTVLIWFGVFLYSKASSYDFSPIGLIHALLLVFLLLKAKFALTQTFEII